MPHRVSPGRSTLVSNIFRKRDFYAGGLMILFGLGAALKGSTYGLGTLMQMGPGFMPTALGVILVLIGIAIAIPAASMAPGEGEDILPAQREWWGWLCILMSPVAFIALGTYGGMAPAIFACVFVAALGDRQTNLKSAAILAAVVTVFGVMLFHYLLRIPMPLFAWRAL